MSKLKVQKRYDDGRIRKRHFNQWHNYQKHFHSFIVPDCHTFSTQSQQDKGEKDRKKGQGAVIMYKVKSS